jgi:hypothetical protein
MNIEKTLLIPCLLILLVMLSSVGIAETASDTLPPEAREPFDKGLAAVEQKEWIVAADSFSKAWKINKQSLYPWKTEPEIVFNWGLAESKVAGRELRATVCFNLYLNLGEKEAANAGAVRKEKTLLEVRHEARLRKLITEAKKFAGQLQGDDEFRRRVSAGGYDLSKSIASLRRTAYRRVALAQARAGDFTGALQTADLANIPSGTSLATEAILVAQGEYHGADERLLKDIASTQAEAEKPEKVTQNMTAMNLRDLFLSSQFNKASLTDPTGALQALASKKKPEDLFDGYMQVIEETILVLRRAAGQKSIYISD